MKRASIACIAVVSLVLSACITAPDLSAWVGHDINDAIGQWGPPDQVTQGARGVSFYSWYDDHTYTQSGSANTYCDDNGYNCYTSYTPPSTNTTTTRRTLTVDEAGTITHWSSE